MSPLRIKAVFGRKDSSLLTFKNCQGTKRNLAGSTRRPQDWESPHLLPDPLFSTNAVPFITTKIFFRPPSRFTMVFGFRVSYYGAQSAGANRAPLCPCARCFSGGEHEVLRAGCRKPAKEVTRLVGSRIHKARIGFRLGRRPSVDSLASDIRPLRKAD